MALSDSYLLGANNGNYGLVKERTMNEQADTSWAIGIGCRGKGPSARIEYVSLCLSEGGDKQLFTLRREKAIQLADEIYEACLIGSTSHTRIER